MSRLWILLIVTFVSATIFSAVVLSRRFTVRRLRMTPDGAAESGERSATSDNLNKPERIVSLAPNLTEILFALGLDEKIVAVSNDSDYPPRAANRMRTGSFWQPNTEAIIASKPDLVVTLWSERQKAVADTLNRLGYRVLTLKIEKIEDLFTAIQEIGTAAGCKQRAEKLVENIGNQLNDLRSRFIFANKVRVLWVVQAEPLRVAGRNTFINELIELVGGENAIGPTIGLYPSIGGEEILACGAEVIIQSAMAVDNIDRQQQAALDFWIKFTALPAVKNNRIYIVESDTTLRLGPRLAQGIEIIAHCLHADFFKQNRDPTRQDR